MDGEDEVQTHSWPSFYYMSDETNNWATLTTGHITSLVFHTLKLYDGSSAEFLNDPSWIIKVILFIIHLKILSRLNPLLKMSSTFWWDIKNRYVKIRLFFLNLWARLFQKLMIKMPVFYCINRNCRNYVLLRT